MKKAFPELKILPSIGGGTMSSPYFSMVKNPEHRQTFIKSVIDTLHTYTFFDGVDIDWEFPEVGADGTAHLASPSDNANYVLLARELRVALDKYGSETDRNYELHLTIGGSVRHNANMHLNELAKWSDQINLMAYDYYGAWNNEFGHHAAITKDTFYAPQDNFGNTQYPAGALGQSAEAMTDLVVAKVSNPGLRKKFAVGVAAYGRGWEGINVATCGRPDGKGPISIAGGCNSQKLYAAPEQHDPELPAYFEWGHPKIADGTFELTDLENTARSSGRWENGIADYKGLVDNEIRLFGLQNDENNPNQQYIWDNVNGTFISLDTPKSVKAKLQESRSKGLGGALMWSIDGDNGDLLNAVHDALGHQPR